MPATVRQYELVYIIAPDRNDDQIQAVLTKYNNIITTQGGTVERTDIWERRRLAYPIKGYHEGVYIVCIFRGLPAVEAELRRVFGISEDTIRSIIVRPDVEIDASVPSQAPRDYSSRPSYSGISTVAVASHAQVAEILTPSDETSPVTHAPVEAVVAETPETAISATEEVAPEPTSV